MQGLTIKMETRTAIVRINKVLAQILNIKEPGEFECKVLGLFQEVENAESAYPVFVVEFLDGRCVVVDVSAVTFTDVPKEVL